MTQVRWDSVFIARLHGIDAELPEKASQFIRPEPVLTPASADLVHLCLRHNTLAAFNQVFQNQPVPFLDNDQVRMYKTVDKRFWELLTPLWTQDCVAELWRVLMNPNITFDTNNGLRILGSSGWRVLQWGSAGYLLRTGAELWLPEEKAMTLNKDLYGKTVPFHVRAQIALTVGELIKKHHALWDDAIQNQNSLVLLITQLSGSSYPWNSIRIWMEQIKRWADVDTISYDDGDFIRQIMERFSMVHSMAFLENMHRDYGIPFGS